MSIFNQIKMNYEHEKLILKKNIENIIIELSKNKNQVIHIKLNCANLKREICGDKIF